MIGQNQYDQQGIHYSHQELTVSVNWLLIVLTAHGRWM